MSEVVSLARNNNDRPNAWLSFKFLGEQKDYSASKLVSVKMGRGQCQSSTSVRHLEISGSPYFHVTGATVVLRKAKPLEGTALCCTLFFRLKFVCQKCLIP